MAVALAVVCTTVPVHALEPARIQPTEYLVKAGPEGLPAGLTSTRDLGFGWSLVSVAPSMMPSATTTRSRFFPNTSYRLLDEPRFAEQWALDNTGQTGGTPGADIDVQSAWSATIGASDQIVAVIDGGVDLDHPDLIDRLWTHPSELAGNGIDDDGNGYIDDIHGWDMVDHDPLPDDSYGHGTAVAGIVAASINGIGIAGAAPGATILPLRVCASSSCSLSAIVEAIDYAISAGVSVITLALGSHSEDPALADAIESAARAGIVVIAAAGNDGTDNDGWAFYPASLDADNIIAVTATDADDAVAAFANTGATSVDLAAPGVAILSTDVGGWTSVSGTSFAVPFAAAVAVLMRSVDPTLTAPSVRAGMVLSADHIADLDGVVASGGRVDAGAAVQRLLTPNLPPVAVADVGPLVGTQPLTVDIDSSRSRDEDGAIIDARWAIDGSPLPEGISHIEVPTTGVHTIRLDVVDDRGASSSDSVTVLVGTDFADTTGSLFSLDIAWMSATGTTKGCNPPQNDRFCPTGMVTRGQFAAFLARVLHLDPTTVDAFSDDDGSTFSNDIDRVAAAGLTSGCNPPRNDAFCPDDPISRGQVAAFLARALSLPASPIDAFADDDGSLFEDDINRLAFAGITRGCNPPANDAYCPAAAVTRSQLAALLHRALGSSRDTGFD